MNWQTFFEVCLAGSALYLAVGARDMPAIRLGGAILAAASSLGALKFSGLLPLPTLHQLIAALGAGVGLPLFAVAVVWPDSAAARQQRYAWILAVTLAVLCVLIVVVGGFKLWSSTLALVAVLAMLAVGVARRSWLAAVSAAAFLAAMLGFSAKLGIVGLMPGDILHIGFAAGVWLLWFWVRNIPPARSRQEGMS